SPRSAMRCCAWMDSVYGMVLLLLGCGALHPRNSAPMKSHQRLPSCQRGEPGEAGRSITGRVGLRPILPPRLTPLRLMLEGVYRSRMGNAISSSTANGGEYSVAASAHISHERPRSCAATATGAI